MSEWCLYILRAIGTPHRVQRAMIRLREVIIRTLCVMPGNDIRATVVPSISRIAMLEAWSLATHERTVSLLVPLNSYIFLRGTFCDHCDSGFLDTQDEVSIFPNARTSSRSDGEPMMSLCYYQFGRDFAFNNPQSRRVLDSCFLSQSGDT